MQGKFYLIKISNLNQIKNFSKKNKTINSELNFNQSNKFKKK